MKLSLVIPCYNEAASLPALLAQVESALAAWPAPYEVIVINDGSTDESTRVLGEIASPRARPALQAAADDQSVAVRSAAKWALRQLGDESDELPVRVRVPRPRVRVRP